MIVRQVLLRQSRNMSLKFLSKKESEDVDKVLVDDYTFSFDQLIELAGQAVACSIAHYFPLETPRSNSKVLVVSGPGNNGADGMVAARHLSSFGYSTSLMSVKKPTKELYCRLYKQAELSDVNCLPFSEDMDFSSFGLIVDAVFGFSFKGQPRSPYDIVIQKFASVKTPTVSVDIPSGWQVDDELPTNDFNPSCLISLTAPKYVCRNFKSTHYLAGRFVPRRLAQDFQLNHPNYSEQNVFIKLS